MKQTYIITDLMSDYDFEMEMTKEEYLIVKTLKDNLGYVMEDISIELKEEE